MKTKLLYSFLLLFCCFFQQTNAQVTIVDNSTFSTRNQMFLANELFESGEPYAEALGYNLNVLDPLLLDQPDALAYTTGIENYEYSRYLLNTVNGRSGIGLHMMWSPVITANAAMTGVTDTNGNGFKEDEVLMMMIQNFGTNANFTPFQNPFPIYAAFETGNTNLPNTVATDFATNFGSTRWNRSLMTKTLNLGAMTQTMWKQYFWAQDMLGAFHDGTDAEVVPTGSNSPDFAGSPNFDPGNNIYYGGNNIDGFIGQVLTAEAINMTKFTVGNLAYDGTTLGAIDLATYDPASGIQYFPTKIAVTEAATVSGLPPRLNSLTVTDATSQLFDQLSFLLATASYRNMMNPNINDTQHYAYHEVFDGFPFPPAANPTATPPIPPGPFNLMSGAGKATFLNIMAMHYNTTEGTFVDTATLSGGAPVMGTTISAENASYIIVALAKFATEYTGTPLATNAINALTNQANYIIANFKDTTNGGYYNSFMIGTGGATSVKTMAANAAIMRGLYAAYQATGTASFLTEGNIAYNTLITNFYSPSAMAFRTELGNSTASYTPWNMAILSGALREAKLVGGQANAPTIYTDVFKKVYNKMIISEAPPTGEMGTTAGSDSDGDGIPTIVGGTKPFVFAALGTLNNVTLSITSYKNDNLHTIVYPNPAQDAVTVKFNLQNQSNININIVDMLGRIVNSNNYNSISSGQQLFSIKLPSLTTGNYFIKIKTNQGISVKKLLIK